jgi:hypothetical protein
VAFSVGQKLTAAQLDNFSPAGDVVAGGKVQATTAQTVTDTQNTTGTTTSTTYTATLTGGTACGVVFVAPASGKVMIFNTTQLQASAGNAFCTVRVRTGGTVGSGTDQLAASDDDAQIINVAGVLKRATTMIPVSGLTPGSTYNAQGLVRIDVAGTLTTTRKKLSVAPTF